MKKYLLMFFILMCPFVVKAATYTTTNDLFENSYTNNLTDMAQTQVDNITTKKYVFFQLNNDYYLVTASNKDTTVSGNRIVMNNSNIIRVQRLQNGYNYYYEYSSLNENSTTINFSHIIISNVNTSRSISSSRLNNYITNRNTIYLLTFILGLIFALFLTKERSY